MITPSTAGSSAIVGKPSLASRKRGKLTPGEKDQIRALATSMNKPTPGRIALRLNRHPATISWFMYTQGLISPPQQREVRTTYIRKGKTIVAYSDAHDRFILRLRERGTGPGDIAALLTSEFGIPRSRHGVHVRLVQLAAAGEARRAA